MPPAPPACPTRSSAPCCPTTGRRRIPRCPPLLELLFARSAGEDWHKAGTFKDHLLGVARILTLWDQPREVVLLGLFHSVYSNEYVDLKLFDGSGNRAELAAALGEEAERLVHTFCIMPRSAFTQRLTEIDRIPAQGLVLETAKGGTLHIPARDCAVFAVATIADIAEQWHSWQDEIFQGFPQVQPRPLAENWAASLWPGPLKPTASALSLLARLARPLRDLPPAWGIPAPPIFAHCTGALPPEAEAAAVALYWQAVTRALPLVTPAATRAVLEAAVERNPWVGEPRLLLAQIALTEGDWDAAAAHARAGLALLAAWGVAWDKRIAWSGWVAWARILVQSAERRTWPDRLGGLNMLGLVA